MNTGLDIAIEKFKLDLAGCAADAFKATFPEPANDINPSEATKAMEDVSKKFADTLVNGSDGKDGMCDLILKFITSAMITGTISPTALVSPTGPVTGAIPLTGIELSLK